ncbi:MAG: diguanylate cyclase, partial [Acidobacteriota bacterium]
QADAVLQEIGWRLGSMVRPYDTLGRFGGDEFLMVLPTCDAIATANIAQRVRRSIEGQEVDYGLGRVQVTLSLAHTSIGQHSRPDPDLLIHRLQDALRESHDDGVNRILEVEPPPSPEESNPPAS